MKKIFKSPFAIALIFFSGLGLAALSDQGTLPPLHSPGEVLAELLDKFNRAAVDHPEDRVYLHLDKPFYKPGETIWFKSFVRNGADMRASSQSDIVHVELINPKGTVEKKIKIISKKGQANGDFFLDQNAPGGLYKIKAYTQWQKNETGASTFEKEVQVQAVVLPKLKMKLDFDRKAFGPGDEVTATAVLTSRENQPLAGKSFLVIVNLDGDIFIRQRGVSDQNGFAHLSFKLPADLKTSDGLINLILEHHGSHESISRSVPIVLNTIDLQLFPEGGDLVQELETRVAFKALNEFGKPADVEGVIENSKGEKICSFKSFHQGMGAFVLKPQRNEKYFAKITQPVNIKQTFELPEALPGGYVLNVTEIKKDGLAVTVSSSEDEEMLLLAQVRGKIYHTGKLQIRKGENKAFIPTSGFPMGVTQITLFDARGIERAERLAFVNKSKQLKVTAETDKEKYLPREKVKLTLKVTDERGVPMPADFSIAVADDKLLSFADDRSGNILSKMFLEYDLKEKVEEPAFYFDTTKEQADLALDYLMMTAGWRRFTWQQIMDNDLPKISFYGEKAIVGGLVADGETGKPVAKARLELLQPNMLTQTNDQGYFSLENVDLSEGITLKITADGYSERRIPLSEYNSNMQLTIYRTNYHTYHWSKPEGLEDKPKARNFPKAAGNLEMMAPQAPVAEHVMEEKEIGNGRKEPIMLRQNEIIELPKAGKEKAKKITNLNGGIAFEAEEGLNMYNLRLLNQGAAAWVASPLPSQYYRARQFPQRIYTSQNPDHVRNDFRSTIYWNGNVSTDRTGKAIVEFYNSDEITSFRVVVEGMSTVGLAGRSEKVFFTQLPFSMAVKAPVEVSFGDLVSIPLTLTNNTQNNVTGSIVINHPAGLHPVKKINPVQSIGAGLSKTIYLDYLAMDSSGTGILQVEFMSAGLRDVITQEVLVAPRGFPSSVSFSGKDLEKEYTFQISNMVPGSLKASFTAYPSVMSDLMKGIESIIREPYGCFEQTSTSNYPNILIKQYLQQMGEGGAKNKIPIPQGLDALLDKGYKKLTSYETKEKGYEWFGGTPAHEALTAYGLMQFNDMKAVYPGVDQVMVDRTANWLMDRRDGKGGFKKSNQALDQFGRANEEVTNAYIVYALSEAGYLDIGKESDEAFEKAMSSRDPYQLALVANVMFNRRDLSRGVRALTALKKLQKEDGSWDGATHSITCSSGNSLKVETTALSTMALLKSGSPDDIILNKAVEFIISSRNGYGGFGSTQGTVLALKALTEYAKYSKRTDEDGVVEIYINGRRIAVKEYKAGETQPILIEELEKFLKEGSHTIRIKYQGVKNPLPYSIAVNYNTFLPSGSKQCKVSLKTEMNAASVIIGGTVRLSATLSNISQDGLPMTMAIIGIPGGMSAQPWQLKEMLEKQRFDFYEVKGCNVFLYFRQMKPGEKKIVNLDLKAETAGEFEAPASCAYLYYTNEFKSWSKPERILIKK